MLQIFHLHAILSELDRRGHFFQSSLEMQDLIEHIQDVLEIPLHITESLINIIEVSLARRPLSLNKFQMQI